MIELSTNAGASWRPVLRTALGPIVRLGAGVEGDLYAIGGSGQNCSAKYVAYGKDGTVMASTNRPVDVWFPHQATMTKSTDRATPKPRLARSRSSASLRLTLSRALVVCDDDTVVSTRDSGETWRPVARTPNLLAVAAGNGRYWVAVKAKGCDGITVLALR
jgi:hypothetical protein